MDTARSGDLTTGRVSSCVIKHTHTCKH